MLLTEYNKEYEDELNREEAWEEGRAEGMLSTLIKLVTEKLISITDAAKQLNLSEADFIKRMEAAKA